MTRSLECHSKAGMMYEVVVQYLDSKILYIRQWQVRWYKVEAQMVCVMCRVSQYFCMLVAIGSEAEM